METTLTPDKSAPVRQAFHDQADYCARLGSPFTSLLCATLAETLTDLEACGHAILNWPGDPSPLADGLPLRVAGALHALARGGSIQALNAIYPPNPLPSPDEAAKAVRQAFLENGKAITDFLVHAPQTNEVGRSAVLMGGFLEIAGLTGLPLSLHEIGSSAGLNLIPDKYRYRFANETWGSGQGPLLAPEWTGPQPALDANLSIVARSGCDINPLDIRSAAQRERLLAYIWPDQAERLSRIEAALAEALSAGVQVEAADAAEWVETRIRQPVRGRVQVLFHSIVWNYLPDSARARISRRMELVGKQAGRDSPLAWLRFELEQQKAALRLSLWPGQKDRLLAYAHPHGHSVEWQVREFADPVVDS